MDHDGTIRLILDVNCEILDAMTCGIEKRIETSSEGIKKFLETTLGWQKKKKMMCKVLCEESEKLMVQLNGITQKYLKDKEPSEKLSLEFETHMELIADKVQSLDNKFRELELYPPFEIAAKSAVENLKDIFNLISESHNQKSSVSRFEN